MTERDPFWENVVAYMGPIRDYEPGNWTYLKQEDILELLIEVTVGARVYFQRSVLEYQDLGHPDVLDFHLTRMVEMIDRRLDRRVGPQDEGVN